MHTSRRNSRVDEEGIMLRSWMLTCALWIACAAPVFAEAASSGVAAAATSVVNINSASAEELERLPGIGPTRSRAILALRTRVQHFHKLEDLLRVKGIGRATFRKLRPFLVLQGPTTLALKAAHTAH
jgi:competence protein ComEA